MQAIYYAIKHKQGDQIVLEGIIRYPEDTIFPQQETGIEGLPHECEAHHFIATGYRIEMKQFDITRQQLRQYF